MVDRRRMRKPPTVRTTPRSGFAMLAPVVATVDAAKLAPAWALAEGGELRACGFDGAPGNASPLPHSSTLGAGSVAVPIRPDVCVLEASRSYGSKDHGKHGDILAESIGGALCAGSMRASSVVLVHPDEWAGTAAGKPPRHKIVWELLTKREQNIIAAAASTTEKLWAPADVSDYIEAACEAIAYGRTVKYSDPIHNLLDVVGLLLFAVGRMGRGGAKVGPRPAPPYAKPLPTDGTRGPTLTKKVRGLG